MNNDNFSQQLQDYQRIEQAVRFLEANFRRHPSLEEIAASVHLSQYHFQRLFKRWAGISPSQFMQYLTVTYAKERLQAAESILHTSLDAGLSGPGRLHDLFVTFEAMTPGEYKQQGAGLQITYGFQGTPFGECLLAQTERGICALRFVPDGERDIALNRLKQEWRQAQFIESTAAIKPIAAQIFDREQWDGKRPFHLFLRGTNFQIQVWQALLTIPSGIMVAYHDVAQMLGSPNATRAVASAIAHNPIGYLIPCHRVISKAGQMHQYRWGSTRKKAILGWEAAAAANAVTTNAMLI